jgi:hypothetical protein
MKNFATEGRKRNKMIDISRIGIVNIIIPFTCLKINHIIQRSYWENPRDESLESIGDRAVRQEHGDGAARGTYHVSSFC